MLAVNLAVPLLFVGWYIGLQNARRNEIIIELRESNSQLQEALQENRGLHAQLLAQAKDAGVREERQRMAREIHDTIAQDLTGVVTQLEAAVHRSGDDGARQRYIRNATQLAREGLAEARRSVLALRPEVLEVSGLPEAIAQTAARWSGLHGTEATLNITGTAATLDSDMEVTLLRVAQEALANVAKHSGADRVTMTLTYLGDTVILDICDDGLGFEPSAASGSVRRDGGAGLIGMRERIERLSGQLEIESSPGSGCIVSASLPVPGTRAPGDQGDTVG
jgi:signal transduction histidine kinase